jgi:heme-degrading monooxygenase HmoA
MFVVMNRFAVVNGREGDFETSWKTRESYLKTFEGFRHFSLLRLENPAEDAATTEFISHTIWRARDDFEVWRTSEAFNRAHAQGSQAGVLAGPPHASLYEAVMEESNEAVV